MSAVVAFHLACVPPTVNHQRKQIVRVGHFSRLADRPQLVATKAMLDALLLPHQIAAPLTGPVVLMLIFTWPWPARATKRTRALGRVVRATKPDCTNVAKTIEDRLVALRFIEDDARVVRLVVEKWWGDMPGVDVRIVPAVPGVTV